tara:strand:+ start:3299 stop:4417 length:1119 start_codon:yes stop_codon:yes gene_type:complete
MQSKILIVTDTYYPMMDGVLKSIEEYISKSKDKYDISILVPDTSTKKIKGIKTFFYKQSNLFKISIYPFPKWSFKNLSYIKKVIKDHDIIFSHGPSFVGLYLSLRYGKKFNKKNVLYIHGIAWDFILHYFPLSRMIIKLFKKIIVIYYNSWDLLISPYHEAKEELEKAGVLSNIEIASLGVNTKIFKPVKKITEQKQKLLLPQKIIIGYVGRICKEKNTLLLLNAFKKLDSEKYFLLVVGDGHESILKQFKNYKNCRVTGFVHNVEEYLRAMDIFVMPSLTETTSLATLEAMSSGLAVIASKVGYIKSYIQNNENGILFSHTDFILLSKTIEEVGSNEILRNNFRNQARKTVVNYFSWDHTASEINKHLFNR